MEFGGVTIKQDQPVVMRDGTVLRADIYRPETPGQYPVLLQRTPYDKRVAQTGVYQHPAWYARAGYIVVVEDVRGRFASDGVFEPYRHEAEDGADTIAWAAGLDGSTGAVGTFGFSYAGMNQLMAAAEQPPALAAAAIGTTGLSFYDGWTYRGGALQLAFVLSWTVQALAISDAVRSGDRDRIQKVKRIAGNLREAYQRPLNSWLEVGELPTFFSEWIAHDRDDDYWRSLWKRTTSTAATAVPCLHIGGWYDIFVNGTIANYDLLRTAADGDPARAQHLILGPWQHVPWASFNGAVDYGSEGNNPVDNLQLAWFDRHLKGARTKPDLPPVRYFLMGADIWRENSSWPPAGSRPVDLYLHSAGRANSLSGDGRLAFEAPAEEPPDIYVFDPNEPVPSVGGSSCCSPDVAPVGAFDQRGVEIRNDVLVYTSPPLEGDEDVVGQVELILFAATDAPDTDWTAKLVDVHPDRRAINLCDGIVRARYRESLSEPSLLQQGRVYEYRIVLGATANRFFKGHAIRLEVSSSNFPAYDVNGNTGVPAREQDPLTTRVATQVVFHDTARRSRLRLTFAGA